jgi:WD40 repeat protein
VDLNASFPMARTPPGIQALAVSPDGKAVATVYHSSLADDLRSGTAKVWDTATGKEIASLRVPNRLIHGLAFAPDGKTLATGVGYYDTPGAVWLWDVPTGKLRTALDGHAGPVRAVAFSGDGKLLASGDEKGIVKIWDPAEGKERASFPTTMYSDPVLALAVTADGKTLATGTGGQYGRVKIWDVTGLLPAKAGK